MDRQGGGVGGGAAAAAAATNAGSPSSSYYAILGIRNDASFSDVRSAYRKLAMKWHPDKFVKNPSVAGEAKLRFQQIQEAYSVLSDETKRSMYDAGLYDPLDEEDEDFYGFMREMISMMNNVKDEGDSFEDLQRMFMGIVNGGADGMGFDEDPTESKRPRVSGSKGKRRSSRC